MTSLNVYLYIFALQWYVKHFVELVHVESRELPSPILLFPQILWDHDGINCIIMNWDIFTLRWYMEYLMEHKM